MKFKWILALLIIFLGIFGGYRLARGPAEKAEEFKMEDIVKGDVLNDVVYKKVGDRELKLDMYRSKNYLTEKSPVVVYVHGGYWNSGDKREDIMLFFQGVENLRQLGYTVVSVNYRLTANNIRFPDHIEDVKDSIRWLKKNAKSYNIASDNIGIMGASAGGHLSLLAGLSRNSDFQGDENLKNYTSDVKYIVSWFGPTDFTKGEDKVVREFLGGSRSTKPQTYKTASPIEYIDGNSPPVFLVHGENDDVVPYSQSKALYNEGKRVGADISLLSVKNANHGFSPVDNRKIQPEINIIIDSTLNFIVDKSK